jgi:18S rRNA (guanine1575-N7)-methyltransferase
MGQGLPLRRGAFDGAISISAVQWLCNADRSSHDPRKRLKRFFETLYGCLARGARAVLQVRRPPLGAAVRRRGRRRPP